MRKNNCEVIRLELDELLLDETCSFAVMEHLRECAACREFHQKPTKLRQIVGGLGTVAAAPVFDVRLRARLANDEGSASFHLQSAYAAFARGGLAVAAVMIVIATGVVLVRNFVNRPPEVVATKDQPPVQHPASEVVETPKPAEI